MNESPILIRLWQKSVASNRALLRGFVLLSTLSAVGAVNAQELVIMAPAEATVGAQISVAFEGETQPLEFFTIVPADAAEGRYREFEYTWQSPVTLTVPPFPGDYEIRYLGALAPYTTRWRQALPVVDAVAVLEAPDQVAAGADVEVHWSGPGHKMDFISILAVGTAEGLYDSAYAYTSRGSAVLIVAPDAPGEYELRYMMGSEPYRTLGSKLITVNPSAEAENRSIVILNP